MSDVRQKAKDLLKLASDERTPENERNAATSSLLKLIEKYDLLSAGGKPINVAASILEKIANLDMDDVERFASGIERGMAALDRVTGESRRKKRAR